MEFLSQIHCPSNTGTEPPKGEACLMMAGPRWSSQRQHRSKSWVGPSGCAVVQGPGDSGTAAVLSPPHGSFVEILRMVQRCFGLTCGASWGTLESVSVVGNKG